MRRGPIIRGVTGLIAFSAALLALGALAHAQARSGPNAGGGEGLIFFGLIVAVMIFYIIPTIVAFYRRHPNRWIIFVINLVFGGTGIGWLGSLVWACSAVHRSNEPHGSHGGESGLNIFANDPVKVRIEPNPALPSAFTPPPLPTVQPEPDLIDRLERLKRLHDGGTIDDDQFRRMRDRLIAEAG